MPFVKGLMSVLLGKGLQWLINEARTGLQNVRRHTRDNYELEEGMPREGGNDLHNEAKAPPGQNSILYPNELSSLPGTK